MLTTLGQRNFALLWFGGLISMIGGWVLQVALPFYVYERTGSALATGAMFMAQTLPGLLIGTLAGVFVDRWDRKRTMVIANLSRALVLLLLLRIRSGEWLWVVYLVAFFESSISQFFSPAENALLPRLVAEKHLVAANSLNALNDNLALLIGPAIGGTLMGQLGLTSVVLLDSVSYLVAGVMISLMSRLSDSLGEGANGVNATAGGERAATAWIALWREWLEGLRLVKEGRLVATVFGVTALAALGSGIFQVLLVPFLQLLGGGAQEFGWLLTVRGIGGLVGGLIVGQVGSGWKPLRLFPLCVVGLGLLALVMFNFPALVVALAILFLWGVPAMGAQVGAHTLLQTGVADHYRGRIFAAYGTTVALLLLAGQGLASALGDRLGTVPMLNLDAGLHLLGGAIALVMLRATLAEHARVRRGEPCSGKRFH